MLHLWAILYAIYYVKTARLRNMFFYGLFRKYHDINLFVLYVDNFSLNFRSDNSNVHAVYFNIQSLFTNFMLIYATAYYYL